MSEDKLSDGGLEAKRVEVDQFWCTFSTASDAPSRCKHGKADCLTCGVSERRDALHTTVNGRGVVGRIRR